MAISALVSSLLQLAVFCLIPAVFYFAWHGQTQGGFRRFLGLYVAPRRALALALGLASLYAAAMVALIAWPGLGLKEVLWSPATVTGKLHQAGPSTDSIVSLAVTAVIATSLSEEIFFRGFVGKRAIAAWGFPRGNMFQAVLFGSLHALIFIAANATPLIIVICPLVTAVGWGLGWIDEREGAGSILPSWVAHGVTNFVAYGAIAFLWR